MTTLSSVKSDPFTKIWHWYPDRLKSSSSNWWFFLLFPEQADGYGPRQMMFALVSCVGDTVQINHLPHPGIPGRKTSGGIEAPFNTIALGWIHTAQQMYDGLIAHPTTAQLTANDAIRAWSPQAGSPALGGEIIASTGKPFAMTSHFRGRRGEARFEVWGDPASEITAPFMYDEQTPVGDVNGIAWRHLHFEGEFTSPEGTEFLSGVGYFQRICLNIPPFPWKWMWSVFQDGSVFSCFVPYLGPHLLRRGNRFFAQWLENLKYSPYSSAFFFDKGTGKTRFFTQHRIRVTTPRRQGGGYPQFEVTCQHPEGDFLAYTAVPYAHTQFLLDRHLHNRWWHSRYNYNEYLFRVANLAGSVGGKVLNTAVLGSGYGNCEYTWGLGI